MPVTVTRVERRIYHYRWHGSVRLEETDEAGIEGQRMAAEHGENPHIQMLDLRDAQRIPLNIHGSARIAERQKDDIIRIVVVGAPRAGQALGQALKKFSPLLRNMVFVEDYEQAVAVGRDLIAEYEREQVTEPVKE